MKPAGELQLGADPLALARSIVAVAANRPLPALAAGLCGDGMSGIRLRVQLLFDYAARWPGPARRHAPFGFLTTSTVSHPDAPDGQLRTAVAIEELGDLLLDRGAAPELRTADR